MAQKTSELVRLDGGCIGGLFEFTHKNSRELFKHYASKLQEGRIVDQSLKRVYVNKSNAQMRLYRGPMLEQLIIGLEDLGWDELGYHQGKDGLVRPIPMNEEQIHLYMKREFAKYHTAEFPHWNEFNPFSLADLDKDMMGKFIRFVQGFCFENGLAMRME